MRTYAYEQHKSTSAVLKECLEGLEVHASELPQLCHEAKSTSFSHGENAMDDLPHLNQEQALVQELGKATESFLRSGILSSLTGSAPMEHGSLRLSDEIIANREELRES